MSEYEDSSREQSQSSLVTRRKFVQGVTGAAVTGLLGGFSLGRWIGGFAVSDDFGSERSSSSGPTSGEWVSPGSKKIRLAVVGGNFGREFFFHEHPNCEVVAVSDLRSDRRKALMQVYGCSKSYDSLETLLKQEREVDAVALFTDAPLHFEHAMACLQRGLHVFVAVPACMTLEEAERLREAVERTELTYMMGETSYFMESVMQAARMYREGQLGEIHYSEVQYYHDRGDLDRFLLDKRSRFWNPDGTPSWRFGFPPMLYGTHSMSLLTAVTGERMKSVSCLGWGTEHPYLSSNRYQNPYWNMSAILETRQGHLCRNNVFWLVAGDGVTASWQGTKQAVHMNEPGRNVQPTVLDRVRRRVRRAEIPRFWQVDARIPPAMRHSSPHGGSHVYLSFHFIDALVAEKRPPIDIYEALAVTVPGIVANESARKGGQRLVIPDFDRSGS